MTLYVRCDIPVGSGAKTCSALRALTLSRPVLRDHGGKWRLAPWLLQHLPSHRTYVEPYGGGASVLMRKPRAYAEVYNDRWGFVVSLFRVLRDRVQAAQLERTLRLTPYARAEFECGTAETLTQCDDPIEQARLMLLRSWAGFGSASANSAHVTGFRANVGRRGTLPALITAFTARLQGVVIEQREAVEVIRYDDSPQTLNYVDPPYVLATRRVQSSHAAYACDMSDDDHQRLAALLHEVRGMVVLSGYACTLYDELYADWRSVSTTALADHGRPCTEVLWLNAAAARGAAQGELFGGEGEAWTWQETSTSPSTKANSCQERGHD